MTQLTRDSEAFHKIRLGRAHLEAGDTMQGSHYIGEAFVMACRGELSPRQEAEALYAYDKFGIKACIDTNLFRLKQSGPLTEMVAKDLETSIKDLLAGASRPQDKPVFDFCDLLAAFLELPQGFDTRHEAALALHEARDTLPEAVLRFVAAAEWHPVEPQSPRRAMQEVGDTYYGTPRAREYSARALGFIANNKTWSIAIDADRDGRGHDGHMTALLACLRAYLDPNFTGDFFYTP